MKRTRFVLEAVIRITLITTLITTLCATAPVFLLQQAYTLRQSLPEVISNKVSVAFQTITSTQPGGQTRQEMMR